MKKVTDIFNELINTYPTLVENKEQIREAFDILTEVFESDGKLLVCGNGGSAADSEHIVGELMKGFNLKRPLRADQKEAFSTLDNSEYIINNLQNALPAISLSSQTSLMTAYINDVAPDMLFAQQVFGYLHKGDALIALSTSGNSANVVNAAKTAIALGGKVIAITGSKKSTLDEYSSVTIRLPADTPYAVQELTLPVYHALCAALEVYFFSA